MINNIILGSRGNLAQVFQGKFPNSKIVFREEYLSWVTSPRLLEIFLKRVKKTTGVAEVRIINCAGVTDPNVNKETLMLVNYELPIRLAKLSQDLDYHLVTFGSVMENFPDYCQENRYLSSKLNFVMELESDFYALSRTAHFRLHTLYGGPSLHRHLFLGQIFVSLQEGKQFLMGNGNQIREYHHIDDDVDVISKLFDSRRSGVLTISHGKPIQLGGLAKRIFSHFSSDKLLRMAAIPTSIHDNLDFYFKPDNEYADYSFREAESGIIGWFESLGLKNGK